MKVGYKLLEISETNLQPSVALIYTLRVIEIRTTVSCRLSSSVSTYTCKHNKLNGRVIIVKLYFIDVIRVSMVTMSPMIQYYLHGIICYHTSKYLISKILQ